MNRADIEDLYGDDEPNLMFADGFDEAIAGVVWDGERTRVVYDTELILELLMGRSEMTYEEAVEYFDFNIAGSYMGEYTPLYLETQKGIRMSRFKDWVIEMQEDAENMDYVMFLAKYGEANIDIWRDYHDPNYENTNVDEYMSEGCP